MLVADQDSGWRLGEFLTGTEAREIADHLADDDTLTAAVRVLARVGARRPGRCWKRRTVARLSGMR